MISNDRLSQMAFREAQFLVVIEKQFSNAIGSVERLALLRTYDRAEENIIEAARQLEENLWREASRAH